MKTNLFLSYILNVLRMHRKIFSKISFERKLILPHKKVLLLRVIQLIGVSRDNEKKLGSKKTLCISKEPGARPQKNI